MGSDFSKVIDRMKFAGTLKNDSSVARALGITPQAISNYRKRGKLPTDHIIGFADTYGLLVDWLLWGEGDMYRSGYEGQRLEITPSAEAMILYGLETRHKWAKFEDLAHLTPSELISIGKLLTILRSDNKSATAVIDHILKGITSSQKPSDF